MRMTPKKGCTKTKKSHQVNGVWKTHIRKSTEHKKKGEKQQNTKETSVENTMSGLDARRRCRHSMGEWHRSCCSLGDRELHLQWLPAHLPRDRELHLQWLPAHLPRDRELHLQWLPVHLPGKSFIHDGSRHIFRAGGSVISMASSASSEQELHLNGSRHIFRAGGSFIYNGSRPAKGTPSAKETPSTARTPSKGMPSAKECRLQRTPSKGMPSGPKPSAKTR